MTKTIARIMVGEDAKEYQDAVVMALLVEPHFKDVHVAASGEEALEAFPRARPDLVLLDFRLPGIDGLETARRMKKQRPEVKIALVTAHSEEILERFAKEASVDEVIPKANLSMARLEQLLGKYS